MLEFLLFFIGRCYIEPFYYLRLYLQMLYPFTNIGYSLCLSLELFTTFILLFFLICLFYFICMLIFPSAVWQCNVVYLADADSEAKRIFSGNEGGQGVEVNPLRTHDVVQMCDIFVRWHGSNWGGGTGGFGDHIAGVWGMPCVRIPFIQRLWSVLSVCSLHTRLELIFML